jgi:hypothetical protein
MMETEANELERQKLVGHYFKPTKMDMLLFIIEIILLFLLAIILKPVFQKAFWCDATNCEEIWFALNGGGDYTMPVNSTLPICNCNKSIRGDLNGT